MGQSMSPVGNETVTDSFASARKCLIRGKHHIVDLEAGIIAFLETQPYTCIVKPDPDGVHKTKKIVWHKPFPEEWDSMAADAVVNLRAALDQAVFAIFGLSRIVKPRQAKFPFADSLRDLEGNSVLIYFPKNIKPFFLGLKPYKGGNDLLWALNRMCNTNKHRLLTPICLFRGPVQVFAERISGNAGIPVPQWDGTENKITLPDPQTNAKTRYHVNFEVVIAFNEVEVVRGQPVVAVLNDLAGIVERILLAIEAEARRLGYIQ